MSEPKGRPYHDPETGMYTYPEPESTDTSDFREHVVEMPSGEKKNILIPPAGMKPSRVFFAAVGGISQTWTVEETVLQIKAAITHANSDQADQWYLFTDPVYGRDLHIPAIVLQNVTGLMEDMTDLQKVRDLQTKEEFEKAEFAKFALEQTARKAKSSIARN